LNATKALRERYGSTVAFVLVYVPDPHPLAPDISVYSGSTWELDYSKYRQALTHSERAADANQVTVDGVFDEVLIDDLSPENTAGNNPVWCSWGPAPNPGWLLSSTNKTVTLGQVWLDTSEMARYMRV